MDAPTRSTCKASAFPGRVLREERTLGSTDSPAVALMVSSMVRMVQAGRQENGSL